MTEHKDLSLSLSDEDDDDVDSTEQQLLKMDEKLKRNAERRRMEKANASDSSSSSSSTSNKQDKDEGDNSSLSSSSPTSSSSSDNSSDGVENTAEAKEKESNAISKKPPSVNANAPPREISVAQPKQHQTTTANIQTASTAAAAPRKEKDPLSDFDFSDWDDDNGKECQGGVPSQNNSRPSPLLQINSYSSKTKASPLSMTPLTSTTTTSPMSSSVAKSSTVIVANPYTKRSPPSQLYHHQVQQVSTQNTTPSLKPTPNSLLQSSGQGAAKPVAAAKPNPALANPYKKTPPSAAASPPSSLGVTNNGKAQESSPDSSIQVVEVQQPSRVMVDAEAKAKADASLFFDDDQEYSSEEDDDDEVVVLNSSEIERSKFFASQTKSPPVSSLRPGRVSLSPATPLGNTNNNKDDSNYFHRRTEEQSLNKAPPPDDALVIDIDGPSEDPANQIIDYATVDDSRTAEIHHSFYAPPPREEPRPRQEPYVHSFNSSNRRLQQRKQIPIQEVFGHPINRLWQSKFKTFNPMQSEVMNVLARSNDNFLISSPTGSGKSTIFDIAMARLIESDLQHHPVQRSGQKKRQLSKERKMVYVAPSKALCEERFKDWKQRLAALDLGIEVAMITGDAEPGTAYGLLMNAHLIVTTPEKFDSLSRRWTEKFFLFASIKLFLIDEVHMVGDESRGWCLETIVCRMKTIQRAARSVQVSDLSASSYSETTPEAIASSLRMVAVSATLPNIADVAALLDASECYTFDQSYRPVPLTTHVVGMGWVGKNVWAFWNNLDKRVPEIISRFSNNKPTIVFCHSKKETEKLADMLTQTNFVGGMNSAQSNARTQFARDAGNGKLQLCLQRGIGYHHAGLDIQDRHLIEHGFLQGHIRVLCATSTLAMGVNLPVHLVIIKGTMCWRGSGSGYQELEAATVLQMTGRAGRPGFDKSGTAVIMTDNASKERVQKLSCGLDAAESHLLNKLPEVINSEISQQVITSTESALQWIKQTFLYARVWKNPHKFGIGSVSEQTVDAFLLYQFEKELKRLKEMGLIKEGSSRQFVPCPASHIMSANLVNIQAAELLVSLPFDASLCQILTAISRIQDIQRPVRRSEKRKLKEAHQNIKFKLDGPPSKVKIQQPSQKVFVLLQCAIGQIRLDDYTLRQEMSFMIEHSSRILSALEEYSAKGSRHGHVAFQSLRLRRSLAASLWGEHDGILNIFDGVGHESTGRLRMAGISSLEDVMKTSNDQLERAANRRPPFGESLRKNIVELLRCRLKLSASIVSQDPSDLSDHIVCTFDPQNASEYRVPGSKEQANVTYTLVAYTEEKENGCLIFHNNVYRPETIKFRCPQRFGLITVRAIASVVGFDEKVELKGTDKIEKSSFTTSHTEKKSHGQIAPLRTHTQTRIGTAQKKTTKKTASGAAKSSVEKSDDGAARQKDSRIGTKPAAAKRPLDQYFLTQTNTGEPQKTARLDAQHAASSPQQTAEKTQRDTPPVFQSRANSNPQSQTRPVESEPAAAFRPPAPVPTIIAKGTLFADSINNNNNNNESSWDDIARRQDPPQYNHRNESSSDHNVQANLLPRQHFHMARESGTRNETQFDRESPPDPFAMSWQQQPINQSQQVHNNRHGSSQAAPSQPTPAPRNGYQDLRSTRAPPITTVGNTMTPPNRRSPSIPSQHSMASSSKQKGRSTPWKQQQREVAKKQTRAFPSKKDNPFSNYKHDPNDSESFLENLCSSNEKLQGNSLIPQQEWDALHDGTGSNNPRSVRPAMKKFGRNGSRGRQRQSRSFPPISERQQLAQKAAEQNAYAYASSSFSARRRHVSPVPVPRAAASQQTATPQGNYSVVTDYGTRQPFSRKPYPQSRAPLPPQYPQQQGEPRYYGDPWEQYEQYPLQQQQYEHDSHFGLQHSDYPMQETAMDTGDIYQNHPSNRPMLGRRSFYFPEEQNEFFEPSQLEVDYLPDQEGAFHDQYLPQQEPEDYFHEQRGPQQMMQQEKANMIAHPRNDNRNLEAFNNSRPLREEETFEDAFF